MEMTQEYAADGRVVPVTLVSAGPCTITRVKQVEGDGYVAVQLGFGEAKKVTKPVAGQFGELGKFQFVREFRVTDAAGFDQGAKIDVTTFTPGDMVQVVGTSKGHGFQGVVKRHGFHGSPASHGHKDQLRMPGSIGSKRQGPVQKGKRMAGRMGNDRVTVKNLEIVSVDSAKNMIAIKGAIPGARGALILVQSM